MFWASNVDGNPSKKVRTWPRPSTTCIPWPVLAAGVALPNRISMELRCRLTLRRDAWAEEKDLGCFTRGNRVSWWLSMKVVAILEVRLLVNHQNLSVEATLLTAAGAWEESGIRSCWYRVPWRKTEATEMGEAAELKSLGLQFGSGSYLFSSLVFFWGGYVVIH